MTKKDRALKAVELLKKRYPDAICSLTYQHPYQLLLATRLSAQCTDPESKTIKNTKNKDDRRRDVKFPAAVIMQWENTVVTFR